jgi:hypothetical protein
MYPVHLVMHGIGTVNETTDTEDTYLYLSVNGTVVYDSTQARLECCDWTDWTNYRVITLIDAEGNSPGGMARGAPYRIEVGASTAGTTRACIHALQISTTSAYQGE